MSFTTHYPDVPWPLLFESEWLRPGVGRGAEPSLSISAAAVEPEIMYPCPSRVRMSLVQSAPENP